MRDNYVGIGAAVWFFGALLLFSVANASKPPERVEDIDCSIFSALPLLLEAQPFLRDPVIPKEADFNTRLAYTQDWNARRADFARRFDKLIQACDEHIKALDPGN